MTDVTIQLEAPFGAGRLTQRTVTLTTCAELDPYVAVSDENGVVYAEFHGRYTVSDDADEELCFCTPRGGRGRHHDDPDLRRLDVVGQLNAAPMIAGLRPLAGDEGRELNPPPSCVIATGAGDLTFTANTGDDVPRCASRSVRVTR